MILPGGVDMHVHIHDGAETCSQGTQAAARGGITTVVDIAPFHVCATAAGFEARRKQFEREAVVDVNLAAGIVVAHQDLAELGAIKQLGASYFKVFMPSQPPVDTALVWSAVQAAARTGLRMALHAEEMGCVSADVNWEHPLGFAHSRPVVCETAATALALEMARAAGAPVHICHVSAGRTAELVDHYRAGGTDVTAETTPHYLLLDESEFVTTGARVKTTPPLRTRADGQMLWQALREGVIDALACDHYLGELVPRGAAYPSLREKEPGIAGLELSLPLVYSAGVRERQLTLERFVQVAATRPAEILGLGDRKGRIAVGLDADLVLWDPAAAWNVADPGGSSRIYTTPYVGRALQGRIRQTLVRGRVVYDGESVIAGSGWGRFVHARDDSESHKQDVKA
ncbi:MAG: dihydroorotase family protein [Chloroflexi bacterium]|nr:dihydroorotase family protein [Chloroflexota bacterium]